MGGGGGCMKVWEGEETYECMGGRGGCMKVWEGEEGV